MGDGSLSESGPISSKVNKSPSSLIAHYNHHYTLSQFISAMDRRSAYSLSVLPPSQDGPDISRTRTQLQLKEFILVFQLDNAFIYRYVNLDETGEISF